MIDLLGRLRGGLNPKRRADLLERFDLDPRKKARTYSKGNRQKVALIAGLASDVELLLLDEPTSGLDPLMEATFREVIREELQSERTVGLPPCGRPGRVPPPRPGLLTVPAAESTGHRPCPRPAGGQERTSRAEGANRPLHGGRNAGTLLASKEADRHANQRRSPGAGAAAGHGR